MLDVHPGRFPAGLASPTPVDEHLLGRLQIELLVIHGLVQDRERISCVHQLLTEPANGFVPLENEDAIRSAEIPDTRDCRQLRRIRQSKPIANLDIETELSTGPAKPFCSLHSASLAAVEVPDGAMRV